MRTPHAVPVALLVLLTGCNDSAETTRSSGKGNGAQADVAIEIVGGDARPATIEVRGFDGPTVRWLESTEIDVSAWAKLFDVRVAGDDDLPAVLGTRRFENDRVVFTPRFPLQPGLEYEVTWRPVTSAEAGPSRPVVRTVKLPAPPSTPTTRIEQVFPSGDELPENLLKFYVHFSAPASRGLAYDHVKLLDENGQEVEAAFLELGEELWDDAGRRFTLFFDPGRIKREVGPRLAMGPALEAGRRYTLVVDTGWLDAEGRELVEPFEKRFAIVAPDATQPDPEKWSLATPPAGTRKPLAVTFDEPLDHAMLQRVLHVENDEGERPAGEIAVTEGERGWTFTPAEAWSAGSHALVVRTHLEDRSGNGIDRPFEEGIDDVRDGEASDPNAPPVAATIRLPFEVVKP